MDPYRPTRPIAFSLALMCAHFVVMFGVGFAALWLLGVDPRDIFDAPPLAFVALAIAVGLDVAIVFGFLLQRVGGYRLRELGWRFAPNDLVLGLAGGIALVGVAFGIVIMHTGSLADALEWLVDALADNTANTRALCVCIGMAAAFTEETLFRGVMQPAMQQRFGRTGGLVLTALVFAAYHGRFAPLMLLSKLGVGLVLGALRDRTGTLWAPAIAHTLQWTLLCFA